MSVSSFLRRRRADALHDFVARAAELLASDDESRRRELESQLAAALPVLRQTPLFEVFVIRHPALRAMLDDDDPACLPMPLQAASNHSTYLAY